MHIDNGVLNGVRWVKAHSSGGAISPRFIVLHDTAGRDSKFSSVGWFSSSACKTSAHFVVERDGTITQMVRTTNRAYHAGVSNWKGVSGLNSCSVGIEIVNPGKMDKDGTAWFGKAADSKDIVAKSTKFHGSGYWLPYTEEQIRSVISICHALVDEYPDCNEIVTHYEIAPKRKIDVNPLFPLEEVRRVVFDPTPGEIEHLPLEVPPDPPPTPKPPSPTKEAAKSPSIWLLFMTVLGKVMDWFFGLFHSIADGIGRVGEILGGAQSETETTVAPFISLTKTLQLNLGDIVTWLTIGLLLVVVFRHLGDKVRLAHLKQQAGEAE